MKKLAVLALTACMLTSMSACGQKEAPAAPVSQAPAVKTEEPAVSEPEEEADEDISTILNREDAPKWVQNKIPDTAGMDFEEGTYMASKGFKYYDPADYYVENGLYLFSRDDYEKGVYGVGSFWMGGANDYDYGSSKWNDAAGEPRSNFDITGRTYEKDNNLQFVYAVVQPNFNLGHLSEESAQDFTNNWFAFGIYDKYTGQLLYNDHFDDTDIEFEANGNAVSFYATGKETGRFRMDSMYGDCRVTPFEIEMHVSKDYDGLVFALLPMSGACDPEYDLEAYGPDEIKFIPMTVKN